MWLKKVLEILWMLQSTDDFLFNILMKFPFQIVYKKFQSSFYALQLHFKSS
jgi:hypothetical protein